MASTTTKSHGDDSSERCAMCGTTGVPLSGQYLLNPLRKDGKSEGDFVSLCPNCNRKNEMLIPNESEFNSYLCQLMLATPSFKEVKMEARMKFDGWTAFVDLAADWTESQVTRRIVVECKKRSSFSKHEILRIIEQLRKYVTMLNSVQVVLAFPGRLRLEDEALLKAESFLIWDIDFISVQFKDAIDSTPHPYFQPLFQAVARKHLPNVEEALIQDLNRCPPGRESWSTYERLVGRILEHLFCPRLSSPVAQSPDQSSTNRRDFVLSNYAESGFWHFMRQVYAAHYIVVDAKNSAEQVTKSDALQVANYLKEYGAGLFGMIVCRKGPDSGCQHTLREQWAHSKKMILVLNDDDVEQMLLSRSSGGNAEDLLSEKLQEFRLGM